MDNQLSSSESQHMLSREKLLYRYSNALEKGDTETIAAILQHAEQDEILEQMIMDLHEQNRPPEMERFYQEDAQFLRKTLQQRLLSQEVRPSP